MGKSKKDELTPRSVLERAIQGAQVGAAFGGGHGAAVGAGGGTIVGIVEEAVNAATGKKKSWKERLLG